jgi:hypothetical protein
MQRAVHHEATLSSHANCVRAGGSECMCECARVSACVRACMHAGACVCVRHAPVRVRERDALEANGAARRCRCGMRLLATSGRRVRRRRVGVRALPEQRVDRRLRVEQAEDPPRRLRTHRDIGAISQAPRYPMRHVRAERWSATLRIIRCGPSQADSCDGVPAYPRARLISSMDGWATARAAATVYSDSGCSGNGDRLGEGSPRRKGA